MLSISKVSNCVSDILKPLHKHQSSLYYNIYGQDIYREWQKMNVTIEIKIDDEFLMFLRVMSNRFS